jgi:hypothetical protein
LLSSHRSGRFSRKPAGGGPDGVAALKDEVENAARVDGEEGNLRVCERSVVGRARTTSIVMGFVVAMLVVLWWK